MCANKSAQIYYNNGVAEYEKGQYDLSIENFKNAIEIDASNFDYHYNLGLAYLKSEQYDLAIASFNNGIALNAKDSELYLNLGLAFYGKGEIQKAVKAYNKAMSFNHSDPEIFGNAGIANFALKNHKEAIFNFKMAVQLEPRNATYNYNLAYTFYTTEEYSQAEEYLVNAINYDRQDYEAYFLLGNVYLKQYDPQLAKENFKTVLVIKPDHEGAIEALKELELKKHAKSKDTTENKSEKPVEVKPEPVKVPEKKVKSDTEIEAEKCFDAAMKLFENKEYEAAIIGLNKSLALVKDNTQAIKALDIASKIVNRANGLYEKGLSNFTTNEFTQAINYLEQALSIYPKHVRAKALLIEALEKNKEQGQIYLSTGQYDLAIESLKTTLAENPEDPETNFNLGNVYYKQKEYDLALDSLRTTLSFDPDHKEAQEAIFNIIQEANTYKDDVKDYFKLSLSDIDRKDYAGAIKNLKKILELDPDNKKAKALIVKVTGLITKLGQN